MRTWQPAINSLLANQFINSELSDTKWLIFRNHAESRLQHVDLDKRNSLIYRYIGFLKGGVWTIHLDSPDGRILKTVTIQPTKGWSIAQFDFEPVGGVHDLYFTYSNPKS